MRKKNSKRYKELLKFSKDTKVESLEDAIKKIKKNCTTKFNESIDVSLKLNLKHNSFNSIDDMNGTTFYSNYQTFQFPKTNLVVRIARSDLAKLRFTGVLQPSDYCGLSHGETPLGKENLDSHQATGPICSRIAVSMRDASGSTVCSRFGLNGVGAFSAHTRAG